MGAIWPIALSNAVLVAAGTPLVWAVGRFSRRPALTHALAVLLLLKLITPPLWRVPIPVPEPAVAIQPTDKPVERPAPSPVVPDSMGSDESEEIATPLDPRTIVDPTPPVSDIPRTNPAAAIEAAGDAEAKPIIAGFQWRQWIVPLAEWVWIAGSVLCAAVAGLRVFRFSRALRFATRARDVQPRANLLARRLGLRAAPPVWFVPGFVSPMLWSLGRPRLLLPQSLWDRLDVIERDTILLHELAHWRRGDPVIRWIELLATCLYWWHPACWWARRELREAEEQCCDAWVLWAMPGTFKNYANALLEAVEFVSVGADRPSARSAVPALASRMGQFVHLRRRLTMLKHGNIARALSWGGLAGVMTLGSFVLPVAPTWGQDRPEPAPEPRQVAPDVQPDPFAAPERRAERVQTTPPVTAEEAPEQADADQQRKEADLKRARMEADRARKMGDEQRAELFLAQDTIQKLRRELQAAQARIAALEARGAARSFYAPGASLPPAAPAAPPAPRAAPAPGAPMVPPPVDARDGKWEYRIVPKPGTLPDVVPDDRSVPPVRIEPRPKAQPGELDYAPGVKDGQYRVIIKDPTTGRIKELKTRTIEPSRVAPDAGRQDRLERIEAQLKAMMGEIEQMKAAEGSGPSR
jgi:beta-lactamase regulating signal transducer with metallopeptidase domain